MKKLFFAAILAVCMAGTAFSASPDMIGREYPWVMRSTAALGMGDAYYAKSDSKYAPFYNPAGLTRVKKWRADILPLTAGINENIRSFYSDYEDTDLDDDQAVAEMLASKIGQYQHADVSFYPGFTAQNFTIGLFGNTQVNAIAANPVLPELDGDVTVDAGLVVGLGMSFLQDDKLQTGVAARIQKRYSYLNTYTFNDIASGALENIDLNDFQEGWGVLFDVGVIYNFYNDGINPRIGLAANNLGFNSFGDARGLPYSFNLSAGISPSFWIINTDIIIDVRDFTQNFDEDYSWAKRINVGLEARILDDRIALRTGLHQGYPTVGFGLDLSFLRLDYAFYQEEVGAYAGQKRDQRHSIELVMGF